MFHLDYARLSLSLAIQALDGAKGQAQGGAEVIAYDHAGAVLSDVSYSAGQVANWRQITVSGGGSAVQYVEVNTFGYGTGIEITDLALPVAGGGLTPYWTLTDPGAFPVQFTNGAINITAHDNETLTIPLQVLRENGSTGAISFQASDGGAGGFDALSIEQAEMDSPRTRSASISAPRQARMGRRSA